MKVNAPYWLLKNAIALFLLLFTGMVYGQSFTELPNSDDLRETGKGQRRDLSIPGSRLVINYFNFNSKLSASEYSNRLTVPLNVAYLTTEINVKYQRMSRTVEDLITMYQRPDTTKDLSIADLLPATELNTEWTPYSLPFSADYKDGSHISGMDFFYDEYTIVRKVSLKSFNTALILTGKINGKAVIENNKVIVNNNNINYAIAVNFKDAVFSMVNDRWFIRFSAGHPDRAEDLLVSIAFRDKTSSNLELTARAAQPLKSKNAENALIKNKSYWDQFLRKLPRPGSFELNNVNSKGVTPLGLRNAYYKAWIFTAQNLLPEDPLNYPYPQLCTGKASLWDEGEIRAPFSAAWESFFGIQFYAYIDNKVAWKAFKGLMSLVDKDGMLAGESLPSRKAQTALILYKLSGDKKSLREVYAPLVRYLNWRMKITHWVHGEHRPSETNKDGEFAFSALVDMEHMVNIAEVLGLKEEAKSWKSKHDMFFEKCLGWFWESPQQSPFEIFDIGTGKRKEGNTLWLATGLYVEPGLKGAYLKSMMERFDGTYDPNKDFGGFFMPKYPDLSYTIYGLIKNGFKDRAIGLLQSNLRDIVRANSSFAEQYTGADLQPDGVRPSLFGSSSVIDFCMLMNGYKYDKGKLDTVRLVKNPGGVKNIPYRNKRVNVSF